MDLFRSVRLRRSLCVLCALFIFVGCISVPAAHAAEDETVTQLTAEQAAEMAAADAAVTALTGSDDFAEMSQEERKEAADEALSELASQQLIEQGSVYYDEANSMYTFTYACGVLGGVLLEDLDAENSELFDLSSFSLDELAEVPETENAVSAYRGIIYYAFDDGVNSTRYPYYCSIRDYWNSMGLYTRIDTDVTISDLKRMGSYDLAVLSAHGAYYTYTYGTLWKRTTSAPVIILLEESSQLKDLRYAVDLLTHRIIKINGLYAVVPSFFTNAYRRGQLEGTIVFSETCEFFGVDGSFDDSMANALLAGGADAVFGCVNNIYSIYSRCMLWDTVNQLTLGRTAQQALSHAMNTYGSNDIIWYLSQGGMRPHAATSYMLVYGDVNARLAGFDATEMQSYDSSLLAHQRVA